MDLDPEDSQQSHRRERNGSSPELPNHPTATNHSPVSSWVAGPQLPGSDNSSMGQSRSDADETRAPLKRSTSRNFYAQRQTESDSTPYDKSQQQANDRKPETKSRSRYDDDTWGTWDPYAPSQPVQYKRYHSQPVPGAPSNRNPFTAGVPTPYASDSRHLSPNYDHRPYVVDPFNPLVRNPPTYAQQWTQPISTVSMPYSLLQPRLDTGVKDFSSYSFASPPHPSGPSHWQGQGSSHRLDRLQSKGSDDSDDGRQGVTLPSDGLHTGHSGASSSQGRRAGEDLLKDAQNCWWQKGC